MSGANSTENFSGYNLNRNSSKVLAPPGGKSSISFGGYDEPVKAPPKAKPAAPAPAPAPAPVAAPAPAPAPVAAPAPAPAAAAPAAKPAAPAAAPAAKPAAAASSAKSDAPGVAAGGRVVKADRFEKDHQVSACQLNRNKSNVFVDNGPAPPKASIRHPPGGTSSITFG